MINKHRYRKDAHSKSRIAEFKVVDFCNKNQDIFGSVIHCGDFDYTKDAYSELFDFEFEHRPGTWKEFHRIYPYQTIHVPGRKIKYMKPYFLYFVVRDDMRKAIMISGEEILKSQTVSTDTSHETIGELFIDVSTKKGIYWSLK